MMIHMPHGSLRLNTSICMTPINIPLNSQSQQEKQLSQAIEYRISSEHAHSVEIITGTKLTSCRECDSTLSKRANWKWLGARFAKLEKWIRYTPKTNLKRLHLKEKEKSEELNSVCTWGLEIVFSFKKRPPCVSLQINVFLAILLQEYYKLTYPIELLYF